MKTRALITKALFAAAALLSCTAVASANTILLTVAGDHQYQQTIQSPCIFENPSCQQGAFVGTELDTGGNVNGYDEFSPVYSGALIQSIIGTGNSLLLGVDINQASGQPAQTLTAFYMLKNGVVVDTFTFGGTGNVPAQNNGNGYADFVLSNFSSWLATDTLQFHFVFNNANDGTENVFLIGLPCTTNCTPPPSTVPEPTSLLLLGTGLFGTATAAARRRKANKAAK